MNYLIALIFVTLARSQSDVCIIKGNCPVKDENPNYLVLLESEEDMPSSPPSMFDEEASDVPTTEVVTTVLSTTVAGTTTTTPVSSPPSIPHFVKNSLPSVVCWCDVRVDSCDINCCCDKDCTTAQKQVFTHCSDVKSSYDLKSCYSSDIFFRKPKTMVAIKENDLFCVVRENLAMMKEFKQRDPIRSIEEFNRELKRKRFVVFPVKEARLVFSDKAYKSGSALWMIRQGVFAPLRIPQPLSGDLCLTSKTVLFLNEFSSKCTVPFLRNSANSSQWLLDTIKTYFELKLVSAPQLVNVSDIANSVKNCSSMKSCVTSSQSFCSSQSSTEKCVKLNSTSVFQKKDFNLKGASIDLTIYHNGSQGIVSADTRIRTLATSTFQMTVKYLWINTTLTPFIRSGNPGYLKGKPILAGRKVFQSSNDTTAGVKEAIQLSFDPKGWLTTFNVDGESCSNVDRRPILFNDRTISSCSFTLQKFFFDKNGCLDLQKTILEHLLGDDFVNLTSTKVNRFVGCYGNSRVEILGDWVQVIVDSFPLLSTQASFEKFADGVGCKGIATSLHIDIAFSKFGSFASPQAKIVGVLFRFGQTRNIFVRCFSSGCENSLSGNTVKLSIFVNFVDLSTPPVHEFAHPPGLEAKLPHDFFYPFFSGEGAIHSPSWCSLIFLLIVNFVYLYEE